MRRLSPKLLRWALVTAAALLTAGIFAGPLSASAWLNAASLGRLHGQEVRGDYLRALSSAPQNGYLRQRAAEALLRSGDYGVARDTLRPLVDAGVGSPTAERLYVVAAAAAGSPELALPLLEQAYPNGVLPQWVAANLYRPPLPQVAAALCGPAVSADMCGEILAGPTGAAGLRWLQGSGPAGPGEAPEPLEMARVAALAGLSPEQVALGDELVANGGFEQVALDTVLPVGWQPISWAGGELYNPAVFLVGVDGAAFSGRHALRIDGVTQEVIEGREAARAGALYWSVPVAAGDALVVSFVYRTAGDEGQLASLFVSADPLSLAGEQWLQPTGGAWQRVTIIAWNRSGGDAALTPLLRNWSEGSVWFDELTIRPIRFAQPVTPREPIVEVGEP
jgi:hypothetical protein